MNIHLREVICTSKVCITPPGLCSVHSPWWCCLGCKNSSLHPGVAVRGLCVPGQSRLALSALCRMLHGQSMLHSPYAMHTSAHQFSEEPSLWSVMLLDKQRINMPYPDCIVISSMTLSTHVFVQDGDRFWRMPEVYIRGNTLKYLRVPEEVTFCFTSSTWHVSITTAVAAIVALEWCVQIGKPIHGCSNPVSGIMIIVVILAKQRYLHVLQHLLAINSGQSSSL